MRPLSFSPANRQFWIRQISYLFISLVSLFVIVWLPKNRTWLTKTVDRFYTQQQTLGKQTDVSVRKREGYKEAYVYTELIRQRTQPTDYFLIPPQRYLIRNAWQEGKANGYAWLYPSVLYYHLGKSVHLLDMTAPDSLLQQATHTFWVYDNKIFLLTFKDHNRPLVMAEFRKYDPHFFAYTPQQAKAYYKTSKP
ncbi:hypothetical protein GO755_29160 [Spirosoma sp. HMF4905]|uniref:Uncharacterized protein n=1 Tax=Spirosoma arboris TaxID=2682092 RepID=A0A7K1SK68_9BACT|nr:hypothetical protein [Spirosoma arboris]MVM34138.1 hypothetical protein [Spirosoma arboris]